MNKFFSSKVGKTLEALANEIYKIVYTEKEWYYGECDYKGEKYIPDASLATELKVAPFECSGYDTHFIVRNTLDIPKAGEGNETVLRIKTGREGQWDSLNPQFILYVDGKMVQGMDVNHTESVIDSGKHDILVYGYTGMRLDSQTFPFSIDICEINKLCEKVWYDIRIAHECFLNLAEHSVERANLYRSLEYAMNMIDLSDIGSREFYDSLALASEYMDKNIFCGTKNGVEVYQIGHTHIDVAWLWTLAQTEEKAQRSFATVIKFMEQYPDYIFMSSQPQLYKYVKNSAPDLYEKIKKAVKEGRWEPEGAMWLEADCNVTSGESFVRQIIHGKDFFKNEFGTDSHVLWLPDVFGYSAALPQILKKCGVDTFVTSKIGWNESNKMPYDAFMWEGIDGSEIFTYFMTACNKQKEYDTQWMSTYVASTLPSMAVGAWERFQQKEYSNKALVTYGRGDGGGGPTKEDLEFAKRLTRGVDGIPQYKLRKSGEFLEKLRADFDRSSEILKKKPRWVGELYLEFHRGTYTSIAKLKKQMRKNEILLRRDEALSSTASVLLGKPYPATELYDNWETVCLNQFHDILPGSSIFQVYEDSDRQMKAVSDFGTELENSVLSEIADNISRDSGIVVYNSTSFKSSGVAEIDGRKFIAKDVPAYGWCTVKEADFENTVIAKDKTLENKFFTVKFDDNGNICSLFDKRQNKEYVKKNEVINKLEISEDYPRAYDAWELTDYYKQKTYDINDVASFETIENGIAKGFKIVRNYQSSTITQTIWLYSDAVDRIDVENEIDWKEEHKILKASFPVNVHANEATYEIQFGNVKRPTHSNTSWDAAKFEVCAHKYADISDNGSGFAILNDCKYGHSAEGSTLKLTLLKCATYPNPQADKHFHSFTYSIYPHVGSFENSDTVKEAYLLNSPITAFYAKGNVSKLPECYSFVSCKDSNIVIETVKKAEKSDDIIVRFYDTFDKAVSTELDFGFELERAYLTDMLENEICPLEIRDGKVLVDVGNFEICTVKACPKK